MIAPLTTVAAISGNAGPTASATNLPIAKPMMLATTHRRIGAIRRRRTSPWAMPMAEPMTSPSMKNVVRNCSRASQRKKPMAQPATTATTHWSPRFLSAA